MKKITMTLDAKSIDRAIGEVKAYKEQFITNVTKFIQRLTERGAEIAVSQITSLGAVESGILASSIQTIMYVEGSKGIVFTDCPWAAFCEFGTGVIGSENPHPSMPWAYNVNGHEKGWVYFDERQNRFRWTAGMPSRPFMFNTIQQLAGEAGKVAKEVFG